MKSSIMAFSLQGIRLMEELYLILRRDFGMEVEIYAPERFSESSPVLPIPRDNEMFMDNLFHECDVIIFIGALGIAVRKIAGQIKGKERDPAVLVLDDGGKYVIPVLSGHLGGANEVALQLAEKINSAPVITTASDTNGVFAIDTWARQQKFHIHNIENIKHITSALLEQKPVGLETQFEIKGPLPHGIFRNHNKDLSHGNILRQKGVCKVVISRQGPDGVYPKTLFLSPRDITIGVGCKRNIPLKLLEEMLLQILQAQKVPLWQVRQLATIDLKKDEKSIIALGKKYKWPVQYFSSRELAHLTGAYTGSFFVKEITGVDNVCERAAVLGSGMGAIVMPKYSAFGITVALAQGTTVLSFEERGCFIGW